MQSTQRPNIPGGVTLVLLLLSPSWALGSDPKIWHDGQAEFAAYEVDWARYGRSYPGRALLVTVKEPWDDERGIKANGPGDGDVIKMNHLREVTTGVYRYHQMASVFWSLADRSLRKLQTSHMDACGQSNALWFRDRLETRSYWHGNEDVSRPLDVGELTEDGLPWTLRRWVREPAPSEIRLAPTLMEDRLANWPSREVRLRRSVPRSIEVPAGRFTAVEFRLGEGPDGPRYLFDVQPPHLLLEMQDGRGTRYRLAKAERLAYWGMAAPEHESWWPEELR